MADKTQAVRPTVGQRILGWVLIAAAVAYLGGALWLLKQHPDKWILIALVVLGAWILDSSALASLWAVAKDAIARRLIG